MPPRPVSSPCASPRAPRTPPARRRRGRALRRGVPERLEVESTANDVRDPGAPTRGDGARPQPLRDEAVIPDVNRGAPSSMRGRPASATPSRTAAKPARSDRWPRPQPRAGALVENPAVVGSRAPVSRRRAAGAATSHDAAHVPDERGIDALGKRGADTRSSAAAARQALQGPAPRGEHVPSSRRTSTRSLPGRGAPVVSARG